MYLRDRAGRHPERPAVIMAVTGETVTFGALEARANQFARLLRGQGLVRGDHIAILMENHARFFEVVAAASRIGLYYTPVSSHLTSAEVAYILGDSTSKALVTTKTLLDVAIATQSLCPGVRQWYVVDDADPPEPFRSYEGAIASESTAPLPDERLGMAMMYSSGTTGRPKGIIRPLPDIGPSESTDAVRMGKGLMKFRADMKLLSPAPLYHAAPLTAAVAGLELGATNVVMDRFEPEETLHLVERYRISHIQMVPTMFSRLLKLPEAVRHRYDLSSLEAVVHSAAPCPVPVKEAMIEWLGPIVYEYYGATESYGFTRCTSQEWLAHKGTVGRAVLGHILILNDEGESCPTGEIGNVWFAGGSKFHYYGEHQRESRSSAGPSDARTVGDVGWVDPDGYLYLTDRKDFMIVSGGVNIYPQEIEDVLVTHQAVADVAVIGVPHEDFGEQVKAVVVLAPGYDPSAGLQAELIGYCRAKLASYKCPRSVDLVDTLPRLESGKLAKRLVREPYWAERSSMII
jgi:long-chain acyl-CoA synthetase